MEADSQPVLEIRRYTNRKLYHPEESRYIPVHQIRDILLSGRDVRVVCNATKRIMTREVLGYAIWQMAGRPGMMTAGAMAAFIRQNGAPTAEGHAEDLLYA